MKTILLLFLSMSVALPIFAHDFDSAMYANKKYEKDYYHLLAKPQESDFIDYVRTTYNQFYDQLPWQETLKIPKIIHQIWLGSELPKRYIPWQKTFKALGSDWEYILWTDEKVAGLELVNQDLFDQTKSFGEKANILRYELLYRFGGVYADTDCECVALLDLLHHTCDFYAGLEYPQASQGFFIVGNALLGARPQHPLILKFIEGIRAHWHEEKQIKRSGTHYITGIIKDHIQDIFGINMLFPANVFYPWHGHHIKDRAHLAQPETMVVHHWDLSWKPKNKKPQKCKRNRKRRLNKKH